jgi:ribose transport system permease protein
MNIKRIYSNIWKTLVWPVAIFVFFLVMTRLLQTESTFGSWASMDSIVNQALLTAMMALAMSCNMINGRWDFSMGIIMMVTSFIASPIIRNNQLNSWALLVLCVVICTILCLINCLLYLVIKVPTLVISIGMLLIYESLVMIINNGGGARLSGMRYTQFGRAPQIYILCAVMFVAFYIIYSHTRFGYNVRSLGNNQLIATNIGVNEKRNTILCYVLCGVFLGVASCINVSMKGTIEASSTFNNNMGMMFTAFPAVFIALYLSRYVNFTVGVFIGAFCIKMLTAGILALGLPSEIQDIGVGLFLFLFIALTTNQGRFSDWRLRRLKARLGSALDKA